MSEAICMCSVCKEEIDLCPYCRDYKPVNNKFCRECFALWSSEKEAANQRHLKEMEEIDDAYNFKKPIIATFEQIIDSLKEKLKQSEDE